MSGNVSWTSTLELIEPDELFLHTLDDLEGRVHPAPSEYEVLGIAGLLRKLLLDDPPLVDRVNRAHRVKLRFRVADDSAYRRMTVDEMGASFWSSQDGLDPETAPPGLSEVLELTRDQFLMRPVMASHGKNITVRDVIKHGANVAGSVHAGSAKEQAQAEIAKWAEALGIGGYPAGTRELQAIGRVVLKALDPLREAVRVERS